MTSSERDLDTYHGLDLIKVIQHKDTDASSSPESLTNQPQDSKKRKEQNRKYGTVRSTKEQEALSNHSFVIHSCTTVKEMVNMVP